MIHSLVARARRVWYWFSRTRVGRLIIDGESAATLMKFIAIGTIGYLVNQIGLFLTYDVNVLPFLPAPNSDIHLGLFEHRDARLLFASIIAVELSIFSNFFWHERWTFANRRQHGNWLGRLVRFNITSLGSPIISVIAVNVLVPYFGVDKYVANTIGVLLGLSWNWGANTRLVWRRRKHPESPVTAASSGPTPVR